MYLKSTIKVSGDSDRLTFGCSEGRVKVELKIGTERFLAKVFKDVAQRLKEVLL